MAAPAALPRLVAFDLDATLWEPEMYLSDGPPFKPHPKAPGCLVDAAGEKMFLLGESRAILTELATEEKWAATAVAYVSRTEHPRWAAACLKLFQVAPGLSMHDVGAEQEIYPGGKQKHFTRIAERTGLAFESMLFFDNEGWNVKEVAELGVVSVHTPRGMTAAAWREGLEAFAAAAAARARGVAPKLAVGKLGRGYW
jgi:magnesium-dependent phosphatase 1